MAATGSDAGDPGDPRARPARGRRVTLRLRLTLLYGGCFVLAAAAVLAITYGFFAHDTGGQSRSLLAPGVRAQLPIAGSSKTFAEIEVLPDGQIVTWTPAPRHGSASRGGASARVAAAAQRRVNLVIERANGALDAQRGRSLRSLLAWSGVALGIMALVSILLGWLLAGRALAPLRRMSSRAREITEESLDRRLAASADARGDELGELATTFDGVLARLQRAFEAQRRFVANASHELRTPVTLERALLELALADPDADAPTLRRACERVLASTLEQQRTIEALLALARSQGSAGASEPADLAVLAKDALALRSPRLREITVAADLHPAPLTGDPGLLERLVANLIDNAVVHNCRHDAWIRVETGRAGESSWLRVANSGPEVPEAMMSEIFEPFRRLDGERTATAAGLGLGLSIVRAITDVHAATLNASPVDGGGLRIEIRFPHARLGLTGEPVPQSAANV